LVFLQKYKNRLLLKYNNFKKINKTFSFLVISLILIASCNPNKENWLNKKWHSLVGHYNIYFNGEEKLNEAITSLSSGHVNDFNKILDIFPYGTDAQAKGVNNLLDDAMKNFRALFNYIELAPTLTNRGLVLLKHIFLKEIFMPARKPCNL
jgi:hypothetical protein